MFVKKCLLALLCGVAVLSFGVPSHAAKLRLETFPYNDGSLVVESAGKWTLQSGTLFQMQVLGGQAVVLEDNSQSEDLKMTFGSSGTDDIYFGLDFTVSGTAPFVGSDTEYFAHFKTETPNGNFNFNTRFDVVAPTGGGDFSVGIASDDSTADAIWATDLTFGTTYRAVARYSQVSNQAELWIDALLSSDPSILGDDKPDPGDIVNGFALRQSSSSFGETILVDNITIASTFAEVFESSSAIPEPASLVLMLVGLAGMVTRRRL